MISVFKLQASSIKLQDPGSTKSNNKNKNKPHVFLLSELQQHQQSQYLVHNAKSSTFLERSTITYIIIDIIIDIFYFHLLRTLSHHLMYVWFTMIFFSIHQTFPNTFPKAFRKMWHNITTSQHHNIFNFELPFNFQSFCHFSPIHQRISMYLNMKQI